MTTVREAIQEYIIDGRARNLSEATIRWYEGKLKHFRLYLREQDIERIDEATKPRIIRQYLNALRATDAPRRKGETLHGHTIAGYDQVLRSFFAFLEADEIIDQNPMRRIKKVQRPDTLIPTFSTDEVEAMLQVWAGKRTFIERRNQCILVLLYDTGIRSSELVRLRTTDVYLDSWHLVVRAGKRSKDRVVPIGKVLRREFGEYLVERERTLRAEGLRERGHLFFRMRDAGALSTSYLYRGIVRKAGELANIKGKRVSPHTWRHTSAVDYIRAGGDAFSLQIKYGHADLETTQIYVRLARGDVRTLHRRSSPMDHLDLSPTS